MTWRTRHLGSVADEHDGNDIGTSDRVITLTDGVVAIAMTLLALDLRPDLPTSASSQQLADYLGDHGDQYLAFAIAFGLTAQYWLVHHRLMRRVRRTSPRLMAVTMLFLFGITLIPLTTYIQGDFANSLSVSIAAANIAFVSAALGAIGLVIQRQGLAEAPDTSEHRLARRSRDVTVVVIPLLVAGLAWVTDGAPYFYFLFFAADVPGRVVQRWHDARS